MPDSSPCTRCSRAEALHLPGSFGRDTATRGLLDIGGKRIWRRACGASRKRVSRLHLLLTLTRWLRAGRKEPPQPLPSPYPGELKAQRGTRVRRTLAEPRSSGAACGRPRQSRAPSWSPFPGSLRCCGVVPSAEQGDWGCSATCVEQVGRRYFYQADTYPQNKNSPGQLKLTNLMYLHLECKGCGRRPFWAISDPEFP